VGDDGDISNVGAAHGRAGGMERAASLQRAAKPGLQKNREL
jgi:hypothetical protein